MTNETAITVSSISKTYRLYGSHRDRMKEFFHPLRKRYHTKHHALKNISFTLQKGEVLGVIGHNGSGKSTLLKILASVVTPNSGQFKCDGRVTALLELGGGFNEELTGVENIYFIGALQGFRKKEMKERVQAILEFAEIGEYAYQPVKSYSSGMYVRLAFSMNININPDILIIDEALSVGDIRFQQKCYRKIKEIKESGKTIVFCSHSLSAVKDFCTRAIWINKGEIVEDGDPLTVTDKYLAFMSQANAVNKTILENGTIDFSEILEAPLFKDLKWINLSKYSSTGSGEARVYLAAIADAETSASIVKVAGGQQIIVVGVAFTNHNIENPGFELTLNGQFSSEVFKINTHYYGQSIQLFQGKPTVIYTRFTFPELSNGNYSFSMALTQAGNGKITTLFNIHDGLLLTVENNDIRYGAGTQLVVKDAQVSNLTTEHYQNQ